VLRSVDATASERLMRESIPRLEKLYLHDLVTFGVEPPLPVEVLLYPARAFHAATGAPEWADGEFDGRVHAAVGGLLRLTPDLERLFAHELAHAFITALSKGRAPRWLQEGLAQTLAGRTAHPFSSCASAAPEDLDHAGSLSFTSTLLDARGLGTMIDLLGDLGAGAPLDDSLRKRTGSDVAEQFALWRGSCQARLDLRGER
jgi:hypothetical protein